MSKVPDSKVPYSFIPIPRFWFKNGILDSKKKNFYKRLHFVNLTLSKCYSVPHVYEGIPYDAFEFSASAAEIAKDMGIENDEAEALFAYFFKENILVKSPHQIKNRPNRYRWNLSKFSDEKVIDLQATQEVFEEKNRNQKQSEKDEIIGTKPKKSEPKSEPNRNHSREEIEKKSEPNRNQLPPSIETNRTIESSCSKETNINKEKAPSDESQDLSLFHKEKDLFKASREKELKEHRMILEALIDMRNVNSGIPNDKIITGKTIDRWLSNHSYQDVLDAIYLMLATDHKKPTNPGGWVETALQKGWPKTERIKKENQEFARQLKENKRLKYLKLNSRYCVDLRTEKDYYYHMNPTEFQTQLRSCL